MSMVTYTMRIWREMSWSRLDPTARRILLAWRMNQGDTIAGFCDRYGVQKATVLKMSGSEGFDELQTILVEAGALARENERLRHQLMYDQR